MEELIQSIYDNPENWTISRHTFNHKGGFKLWIPNGLMCCRPYESGMNMSYSQKWRIWIAYKWWCSSAPLASVK